MNDKKKKMNNFEKHLLRIDAVLKLDPYNNIIYIKDYKIVREYVLSILRKQHKHFDELFSGWMEFGSYSNDLRIHRADEFDVLIKFKFPFQAQIEELEDDDRPGFINLDFTDVCSHMTFHQFDGKAHYYNFNEKLMNFINERLTCNELQYLERTALRGWLNLVFRLALQKYGNKVQGHYNDTYTLSYAWRGVAFTITAKTAKRTFAIDFVPAVEYNAPYRANGTDWLAVPKTMAGPKETAQYSFILCNPNAEKRILDCNGNPKVKIVLRLLQSLRNEKDLPDLKCNMLVNACMWQLKKQSQQFWQNPIDKLLIHMLDVLAAYFVSRVLPFYWDADLNLIRSFNKSKCEQYAKVLTTAHNTLSTYQHQPQLSLNHIATHFNVKF